MYNRADYFNEILSPRINPMKGHLWVNLAKNVNGTKKLEGIPAQKIRLARGIYG